MGKNDKSWDFLKRNIPFLGCFFFFSWSAEMKYFHYSTTFKLLYSSSPQYIKYWKKKIQHDWLTEKNTRSFNCETISNSIQCFRENKWIICFWQSSFSATKSGWKHYILFLLEFVWSQHFFALFYFICFYTRDLGLNNQK